MTSGFARFWRADFTEDQRALLFERIRPLRRPRADGQVTITDPARLEHWSALLVSALCFPAPTQALRRQIVDAALRSATLPADFSQMQFRRKVLQLRKEFEGPALRIHHVVFPILNRPPFLTGVRTIDDVSLNFTPSGRGRILSTILQERTARLGVPPAVGAGSHAAPICVAQLRAAGPDDAQERAARALHETLGLVNLARDASGLGGPGGPGGPADDALPLLDARVGAGVTIHRTDGRLAGQGPAPGNPAPDRSLPLPAPRARAAWQERTRQFEQAIALSNWRGPCKWALVRYYRAFANPDPRQAFLDGWHLFESICGTRRDLVGAQVNRAANLAPDPDAYRILGRHLALRRDLLIRGHDMGARDHALLARQMCHFVSPFLQRYLLDGFGFRSPGAFRDFLESPAPGDTRSFAN